jgi:uncharacterized iron-regulated protein
MVDWNGQKDLGRFEKGEIDLDGLADALAWKKSWGFSFDLYRDLVEAAQEKGAHLVALNAPRAVVRRVAKGGIEALSPKDRDRIPELDLTHTAHRKALRAVFQHHAVHGQSEQDFERFYAAQVLRDETMAERGVAALQHADRLVVVTGAGHVAAGAGIPMRMLRRDENLRVMSLVPVVADEEDGDVKPWVRQAIIDGEGDVLVIKKARETIHL